jgi:nucleoside 2-deoxyribosyltransferase
MKGYLANGLFNIGDRIVNEVIAREVRTRFYLHTGEYMDLYSPQENDEINDKESYADSITIYQADTEKLMESDFLIAVIDGVEIDSGVACEIGMFSTTGKPIFALYSDVRQQGRNNHLKLDALMNDGTENQFMYRNLFVVGAIKQSHGGIYDSINGLVNAIHGFISDRIPYTMTAEKLEMITEVKEDVND